MTIRLRKIVSGGQTGADQAGLAIGAEFGLETGGFVPKGWRTQAGSAPWLARYGCKEHWSSDYPPRTRANVAASDGTVWFGRKSPGFYCTQKAWLSIGKPYIVNPTSKELRQWLIDNNIEVLNVAGNRVENNPGVINFTKNTIREALKLED